MKLPVTLFVAGLLFIACSATAQNADSASIHQFAIAKANGGTINFSAYAGKKILVVNTASLSNNKQQIADLQTLQQQNNAKLVVVAIPCTDFNNLEPEDSSLLIFNKYQQQFGVTYPVAVKLHASGPTIHPLFIFMTRKEKNAVMNSVVKTDFYKYLFDNTGRLIGVFNESIQPLNPQIQNAIDDN
jgi:glutathione peroxidase